MHFILFISIHGCVKGSVWPAIGCYNTEVTEPSMIAYNLFPTNAILQKQTDKVVGLVAAAVIAHDQWFSGQSRNIPQYVKHNFPLRQVHSWLHFQWSKGITQDN